MCWAINLLANKIAVKIHNSVFFATQMENNLKWDSIEITDQLPKPTESHPKRSVLHGVR